MRAYRPYLVPHREHVAGAGTLEGVKTSCQSDRGRSFYNQNFFQHENKIVFIE